MNLSPLSLEFGVLATAGLVFVADLLLGGDEKRGLGALSAIGLGGVLVASFFLPGLEGAFGESYVSDPAGLYFKRVLLLASFLGVLGSIDAVDRSFPRRQGEHYLLLILSTSGMLLLTGATDALTWIVGFELAGMPLYVLSGLGKDRAGAEASLKLYLTGMASSAFTLYGFSLLWGMAGDTSFAGLGQVEMQPLFLLGILMVVVGVGFKVGAVPFHMWMADTYQGAPSPTVAFLSVAPKVAVFAGLTRLFLVGLLPLHAVWGAAVVALTVVTLVQGNLSALPQQDSRRLLALSGVGHMSLWLLALATGTSSGLATLLFYTLAYVVTNMGAFFVVGAVVASGEGGSISALNGLARRSPALSLALLVFLLSLGGIPFMAGFWAKLMVFWAAWQAGLAVLVVLGAVFAVLALFYYLKMARAAYIEPPSESGGIPLGHASILAIGICALAVLAIGLLPGVFAGPAFEAARLLMP